MSMARATAKPAFTFRSDFATALDKVVTDPAFRERLDRDPVNALGEIGVEISSRTKATLVGKRLAELIPVGIGRPGGEVMHPGVLVVVGVAIGTNLRVDELKDRVRYRKAVRARIAELTAGPTRTGRGAARK
jgi:hypothetical protein